MRFQINIACNDDKSIHTFRTVPKKCSGVHDLLQDHLSHPIDIPHYPPLWMLHNLDLPERAQHKPSMFYFTLYLLLIIVCVSVNVMYCTVSEIAAEEFRRYP